VAKQAKIREAEIELNATRNNVMVAVTAQYGVVEKAREVFVATQKLYLLKQEQQRQGRAFSTLEMTQAEIEMNRAAAALVQQEAELMKLVGRVPGVPAQGSGGGGRGGASPDAHPAPGGGPPGGGLPNEAVRLWDLTERQLYTDLLSQARPASAPPARMADKLKAALESPVHITKEFKNAPAREVLEFFKDKGLQGIPMRITPNNSLNVPIDLMTGELPLSAWLQAVQDSVPDLRFVVREYGLLVTSSDRVPPDGLLLGDFIRQIKVQETKAVQPKKDEKASESQPTKPKQ
jgi:hypothetical protein